MVGHDGYPGLTSAMRSLIPLLQVLPPPVHVVAPAGLTVASADQAELQRQIGSEAERHAVSAPVLVPRLPAGAGVFNQVVGAALGLPVGPAPTWQQFAVAGFGGSPLRAYAAGPTTAPAVLVIPPCGMPVELIAPWLTALSQRYRVLTWETGGLFGTVEERAALDDSYLDGNPQHRVQAQSADAIRVLEHFSITQADVVGLCGGAVLALAAAADRPDLVRSVSLWHADFLVHGLDCRTQHQANLAAVLDLGSRGQAAAASVHDVLTRSLLDSVPVDLAHLVLHPYATAEMLYRYCRINGAIMALDAAELVSKVGQPVLVVTSEDDHTAHPNASREVARTLACGELVVRPHGDHIALFRGADDLFELAVNFISDQTGSAAVEAAQKNRATP